MAKGKTFTYVLMVGVAAVWGIIFYRIYVGMSEETPLLPILGSTKVSYFKMINHQTCKVNLDLNYRDHFMAASGYGLSDGASTALKVAAKPQVQPPRPVVQQAQVNWSTIQYIGYVNNAASKQKMVLLSINGNSALLAEGQSAHGVKLLKYFGDSIRVHYQGEVKHIKIK